MSVEQLTFRISDKLQAKLENEAERLGLNSKSEVLRYIVLRYFDAITSSNDNEEARIEGI